MSKITASRVPEMKPGNRTLYRLSEPTTSDEHPEPFQYVVVSLGRLGDTSAFPSDDEGRIRDPFPFGFLLGPSRWLPDEELDAFVQECIDQHERDGGAGDEMYPS